MSLNPPTQYLDDANLRARQRLWTLQDPPFDLVGWVLDVAGAHTGSRVLDVGCGNGSYLERLAGLGVRAAGVDLSFGMLQAGPVPRSLVNADVCRLPVRSSSFDVVLAPHMLYHVSDRATAAAEMRRVLSPGGVAVIVTNGAAHIRAIRELVEAAATDDASWTMRSPSLHAFGLENGAEQLGAAFDTVDVVRPEGVSPIEVHDPDIFADYVASTADHYEHEIGRPWSDVVRAVRSTVAETIAAEGVFRVDGDVGAFVCRARSGS